MFFQNLYFLENQYGKQARLSLPAPPCLDRFDDQINNDLPIIQDRNNKNLPVIQKRFYNDLPVIQERSTLLRKFCDGEIIVIYVATTVG